MPVDGAGLSWFLLMEGETMTTIESTSQVLDQPGPPFTLSEDQLAAVAFLARLAAEPWRPTATTCAACSNGRPITG
jgi:hypothetical protein